MPLVKKIDIDGTDYELNVNANGEFWANTIGADSHTVKAPTMDALITKLRAEARKKPMAIPVSVVFQQHRGGIEVRHGTITGIHGRTRNVLMAWDTGDKQQLDNYGNTILARLTDEGTTDLVRLHEAKQRAAHAYDTQIEACRVNVKELIDKAKNEP